MKKMSLFVMLALLVLSMSAWANGSQGEGGMAEKITLHMMSHRYPALEFYAEELQKAAPPNVRVETELMPYDQFIEKMRIDDKRDQAIEAARAGNGFRSRAETIRWLLAKGAMFEGYWPDDAILDAPTLRDPGVEYHTEERDITT